MLYFFKSIFLTGVWTLSLVTAVPGLCCLAPGFSGCCEQGLFFLAAPRLLGVVPSLPLSTGSGARGLSSHGAWPQRLWPGGSGTRGLSSCGLEALGCVASAAVAWRPESRLSGCAACRVSQGHVGSSQARDQMPVLSIGR